MTKNTVPKFDDKDKLADYLKAVLKENVDLIQSECLIDIQQTVNELYNDEADANYEQSYEESYESSDC